MDLNTDSWEDQIFSLSEVQGELDPLIEKPYSKIVDVIRSNAERPLFVVESKGLGNNDISSERISAKSIDSIINLMDNFYVE